MAYQATPMDLTNQSHTLDPALKASRARRIAPIRLLKKDEGCSANDLNQKHCDNNIHCSSTFSKFNISSKCMSSVWFPSLLLSVTFIHVLTIRISTHKTRRVAYNLFVMNATKSEVYLAR